MAFLKLFYLLVSFDDEIHEMLSDVRAIVEIVISFSVIDDSFTRVLVVVL